MNFSKLRKLALPALLLGTLVLTGCAGMRAGPGTTTGAMIGGAASILNGDGGRAAVIGVGVGAAVDILNGEAPIEVETYRGSRSYRDDRRYRPAPPPPPRRRFYDERCGCYR